MNRLTKQAARKHGTTKGFEQDYVRAALMERLEKDEKSSVTEPEVEA